MKKFFAIGLLLFSIMALPASTNAGIYDPNSGRCHDAKGKFVPGPNCDPDRCQCLFHEIGDYIKSFFTDEV